MLGNLPYPLSVQTVAVPKFTKISLLPKERCDDTFPTHNTPHSLLRGGGACTSMRVSACLYSKRLSVKSKGPISHSIAAVLSSQHLLGSPILCDTMHARCNR